MPLAEQVEAEIGEVAGACAALVDVEVGEEIGQRLVADVDVAVDQHRSILPAARIVS